MAGMPAGMPMPRFVMAPRCSSSAARHAHVAAQRRIELRGDRLHLALRLADHDIVDQEAGHLHPLRMQAAGLHHLFHLRDHDAAAGARGLGDLQLLEVHAFLVQRDVALFVGEGAADDRHVDLRARVVQPFFAGELGQVHQVLGGAGIQLAALLARIDEGAESDLGEQARRTGRDVARQVRQRALREVVGLHLVRIDHPHHFLAGLAEVAGHRALDHALVREVHHAAGAAVADGAAGPGGQVARVAVRQEAALEGDQHFLGQSHHGQAAQEDGGFVAHQGGGGVGTNDLHGNLQKSSVSV
jgi:hypothetical protein